jgi:hypothetical protein
MSLVLYVVLWPFALIANTEQSLNSTVFQQRNYHRVLAASIEQPKVNPDTTPPWVTCSIIKSGDVNTKACDPDFDLGRLEDVCVKYGCMDNVPDSVSGR